MSEGRSLSSVRLLTVLACALGAAGAPSARSAELYEKCTDKNSYLEQPLLFSPVGNGLLSLRDEVTKIRANSQICANCAANWFDPFKKLESMLPRKNLDPIAEPTEEDLRCVALTQSTYKGGGGYAKCDSTESKVVRLPTSQAPCVSKGYVELTTRAFNLTAACTGTDRRELFGLFAQESGFHLTALSHTKAGGIGQMTSIAIRGVQEIDKSYVISPSVKDVASDIQHAIENNPKCSPLKEANERVLTRDRSQYRCEILAFPRNPLYPMLLSLKHYAYSKKMIQNQMADVKLAARFNRPDRDRIATDLAYYAYNGGVGGVWGSFAAFLKTANGKTKSVPLLLARFRKHLLAHYPYGGEAKRKEIAGHVYGNGKKLGGIYGRMDAIDRKAGGRCFE